MMLEHMPDMGPTTRRIVVQAGENMRIVGYSDTQPPDIISIEGEPVTLVKVLPRMYLYKPLAKAEGLGTFDKAQR